MSNEKIEKSTNKRHAESDNEEDNEEVNKRAKIEEKDEEEEEEENPILDAIKTIDRIQYELNMHNVLLDSPETSDHDTPPQSDDEEPSEISLSQAHALGFAACVRETFRFLESCGIPENDPIYKQLKSRFIGISN